MKPINQSSYTAEVSGEVICSVLKALPTHEATIRTILSNYSIDNPNPEEWYSMENYLSAFQDISRTLGPHLLFSIGKSLSSNFAPSDEIDSLETVLEHLDEQYHHTHRGNNIGHYKLISFDKEHKEAKIECKNPYPCYLDRGVLMAISQQYKPSGARLITVELDTNRPNRLVGSDVSYYNILWV